MVNVTTGPQTGGSASGNGRDSAFVVVVSGLPRSGTSMMMRMLEVGGIPVLSDGVRKADVDNPRGYYEFEPAKKTKDSASWLETAVGMAVKMVYRLLYDLPADYRYRVLFMRRKTTEVLASQQEMLARQGKEANVSDDTMSRLFCRELEAVGRWLSEQDNFSVLDVNYNHIIEQPKQEIVKINEFVGPLDMDAMCQVVDRSMYRNRSTG